MKSGRSRVGLPLFNYKGPRPFARSHYSVVKLPMTMKLEVAIVGQPLVVSYW